MQHLVSHWSTVQTCINLAAGQAGQRQEATQVAASQALEAAVQASYGSSNCGCRAVGSQEAADPFIDWAWVASYSCSTWANRALLTERVSSLVLIRSDLAKLQVQQKLRQYMTINQILVLTGQPCYIVPEETAVP
jgi:hypothetical protein